MNTKITITCFFFGIYGIITAKECPTGGSDFNVLNRRPLFRKAVSIECITEGGYIQVKNDSRVKITLQLKDMSDTVVTTAEISPKSVYSLRSFEWFENTYRVVLVSPPTKRNGMEFTAGRTEIWLPRQRKNIFMVITADETVMPDPEAKTDPAIAKFAVDFPHQRILHTPVIKLGELKKAL